MSKTSKNINSISSAVIRFSMTIIIIACLILGAVFVARFSYSFGHDIFYNSSVEEKPGRDIYVTIESTDASEVGDILKAQGIIANSLAFYIQSKFFEIEIQPGIYSLNTSQSVREILEILAEGPTVTESSEETVSDETTSDVSDIVTDEVVTEAVPAEGDVSGDIVETQSVPSEAD